MKRVILFQILIVLSLMLNSCVTSPDNSDEKPMYGSRITTLSQRKANLEFIDRSIKASGSRETASNNLISKGWELLIKEEMTSAIKRLNQAWLLNPNDARIFWGFGVILAFQSKYDDSIEMFEKANSFSPNDAGYLSDYGGTYASMACDERFSNLKDDYLKKAVALLKAAENLNSTNPRIYSNWARVYFCEEKYKEAWEMIAKAQSLDPHSVDSKIIKQLSNRFPMPSNIQNKST